MQSVAQRALIYPPRYISAGPKPVVLVHRLPCHVRLPRPLSRASSRAGRLQRRQPVHLRLHRRLRRRQLRLPGHRLRRQLRQEQLQLA